MICWNRSGSRSISWRRVLPSSRKLSSTFEDSSVAFLYRSSVESAICLLYFPSSAVAAHCWCVTGVVGRLGSRDLLVPQTPNAATLPFHESTHFVQLTSRQLHNQR